MNDLNAQHLPSVLLVFPVQSTEQIAFDQRRLCAAFVAQEEGATERKQETGNADRRNKRNRREKADRGRNRRRDRRTTTGRTSLPHLGRQRLPHRRQTDGRTDSAQFGQKTNERLGRHGIERPLRYEFRNHFAAESQNADRRATVRESDGSIEEENGVGDQGERVGECDGAAFDFARILRVSASQKRLGRWQENRRE